jgi:hypothetical protein
VGDDAVKHGAIGIAVVEVSRIHIARDIGEQFDVVLGEGAHDLGGVTRQQFVEDAVLDEIAAQQVGAGACEVFQGVHGETA